jgi:hypothetical protein
MIWKTGLTMAILIISGAIARAEPDMILIESLSAPVAGAAVMDYVLSGTAFDLGRSTVAILDHLDSCTRETATGGVLHVGEDFSKSENGRIERDQFDCDGHQLQLNAAMTQGGGQVYRALGRPVVLHPVVLYSTAPLILARPDGVIRIERLDQPAPVIEVNIPASADDKPVAIDFVKMHEELARGASYRLSEGRVSLTFSIDAKAAGANAPLLSRLLTI